MNRRIMLSIVTSEDGTRCDAGCPHVRIQGATTIHDHESGCDYDDEQWFCDAFGCVDLEAEIVETRDEDGYLMDETFTGWLRHPKCVEAEQAAREAEIEAVRRGHDIGYEGDADLIALDAEIARIRGGKQ